ncbi:enolase C-terminal domain-like protein [Streptomyces luteireticuli]|uniref:enolase C-terminal domain-like protein n=1 Tax=Streptomyces luteireticuli TaxID=173858 RepID=UPI00355632DF
MTQPGPRLHTVPVTPRTTWLFVFVHPVGGAPGWGECSDIPASEARRLLAGLAPLVAGLGPQEATDVLDRAGDAWSGHGRYPTGRLHRRTVLGGLATALADSAARTAGAPLGAWLARRAGAPRPRRTRVPLYANINRALTARTPQAAAELAARAVAEGHRTVKCAPFDGLDTPHRLERGLEIAHAVRDAIGPGRTLLLDAHHLLKPRHFLARAEEFTRLRPGWLEDAAPLSAPGDLLRIRDALGIPLAGGEFAGTAREILPALRAGALDVLLPDVKHAGGPLGLLRLAGLATDHGARVSLHNLGGPVATAASAHLTAHLSDGLPLEAMYGETPVHRTSIPPEPLTGAGYTLGDAPGLGLTPVLGTAGVH